MTKTLPDPRTGSVRLWGTLRSPIPTSIVQNSEYQQPLWTKSSTKEVDSFTIRQTLWNRRIRLRLCSEVSQSERAWSSQSRHSLNSSSHLILVERQIVVFVAHRRMFKEITTSGVIYLDISMYQPKTSEMIWTRMTGPESYLSLMYQTGHQIIGNSLPLQMAFIKLR